MGTSIDEATFAELEQHRNELTAYCYRMLGSPFDAQDAAQDTLIRAWNAIDKFEGRSSLRSWLYRIATNVCLDSLKNKSRRTTPMDLGPAQAPVAENLNVPTEVTWIEPMPDSLLTSADPADKAVMTDTVRLAFVAALQQLPPKQRASLILCEVLGWKADEVAELLDTSTAAVNSALQRARATLESDAIPTQQFDDKSRELLERYVAAFEAYDVTALTKLIHEDATQSMPPFDMWLSGREDILTWWYGPGIGCEGSRVVPVGLANGSAAFGQYKPDPENGGFQPWALQVVELAGDQIGRITFFLDTERLFPLFGLPLDFSEVDS